MKSFSYKDYNDRFEASFNRITAVYDHQQVDRIPFIAADISYWLDGENPDQCPQGYFDDPEVMTNYQMVQIKYHLEHYVDDYIPVLFPWFGTGVVPSALGCEIVFHDYGDPSVKAPILKKPEDIRTLKKPDPYKDGLMPKVLETIDYMCVHTDIPVSFTDPQGPLNIALCICGVENFFIWLYEYPELAHEIMAFCTDVFIDWVKVQKEHMGKRMAATSFPHGIVLPEAFGGIWLADDDCTVISAKHYKEFVVPYNSRILKTFGGGTIHFCGSAEHQIANFLLTDGCVGINNFCMGNFEQIYQMQAAYEDKMALMVCDFTPLDYKGYYDRLFEGLKVKGVIIASFISAEYALSGSKYVNKSRNVNDVTADVYRLLRQKCQRTEII